MRCNIAHFRTLGASLALLASLACGGGLSLGVVYTERRPPPDRVEVTIASPGEGYVWVGGHWRWDSGDFAWTPGHWVAVERGYHHWVSGHWANRHHRWYWVEGHWAR
jgi:WXXGXW repeat (2 copies)